MSKIKKILIAVLSVIMLASTVGLIACENGGALSIETKEPKVKYYIGYNVDMFDFFVQEGGVRYTFTVKKDGEEESVATGRMFYVSKAGEYTATCTATKNGKSVSAEYSFVVYDSVPYMLLAKNDVVVDWMKRDSLNNIFGYSQARVITESSYDQVIDYVLVYDQADGTGRKVDLSLDNPSGDGMWDGRRAFTFTFEGKYEFHLCAISSGGADEEFLRVTATENYSKYADVDTTITIDEIARTAKWTAVEGAKSYRIKLGTKSVTVDNTELDINAHLDKDFSRFDFAVIALDADGKVIGKKVSKDVVITPKGYEGIVLSNGAHVDTEKSEVNIIPAKCSIHSVAGVSKEDTHFLAYRGEYGVGYFVDFYFTGNNLPQVCLFSNDMDTNLTNSEGGKGILIMNGMYSGNTPDLLFNSLRAFGPNRLDAPYNHGNLFVLKAGYEQFSKTYLQKEENANNKYKYVVGTEETAHGTINLVLQLWTVDDKGNENLLYLVNKDTKIKVEELPAGNIVAYGAMAGPGVDTTFKFCKKPYSYSAEGIKSSGAIFTTNGEIWLAGKGLGSSAQPFTIIPTATNQAGTLAMGMSNSFVGLEGEYGVGTYMDIFFKGNNMPEVMFFADNINGNMSGYSAYTHAEPYTATDSGEKGVLISNGMKGHEVNDINEYFTVWGPNRVHLGEGAKLNGTFASNAGKALATIKENDANFGILTQSVLSKAEYADVNFKYTVGTFDLTGKLGIHVKLYKIEGETETLLCEYIKDTTVNVADLDAGAIVMYGTVKGETELTKFSYAEPYTSKPDMVYSDGTVATDGTIELAGRGLGSSSQPFTVIPEAYNAKGDRLGFNNSYVALLGEYGTGTYLDITFTGNNMPEVMFFADKVNGNMSGYASYKLGENNNYGIPCGEKGLLISNGMKGHEVNDINEYFTIWGPNKLYVGDNVALNGAFATYTKYALMSIGENDANFGAFVQSNLAKEENANTNYKYTIGTYEVSGKIGVHAVLYKVEGNQEIKLAELVQGTNIAVSDLPASNIVLYGTVKGNNEVTTFKMSKPYESEPPYIASGASVSKDGTITTNSMAGGNRMCNLWQLNSNFYALNGKYGIGTYVDAYFTGNNMPEIMMFANAINGNMTGYETMQTVSPWSQNVKSDLKGLLFSNGFAGGGNNNGAPDKYTIWGMDRVFSTTGLGSGLRDATSGALKIYDKTTDQAKVLSQLSLDADYADTQFKYTVGTYADGDKMAVEVIMANAVTGEELVHINYTTKILVADVEDGSIIFYDTIKGAGKTTVFKVGEPYTFGEEGHTHDYTELKSNIAQHWYECECGKWESKIAHFGGTATCDTKAKCEVCETTYGEFKHNFTELKKDATHHWYECSCGEKGEKVEHFGGVATVTEKAKCEVCEEPYGELLPEGTITTKKATENADGSYTVTGGSSASAAHGSGVSKVDLGYVAIQGNYGAGVFVEFEFTGNNLPQVMFFANDITSNVTAYNGSATDTSYKGLFITNGIFSTSYNAGVADQHYVVDGGWVIGGMHLSAFGPNRINNNVLALLQTTTSRATRVMSTDSLFTYKGLSADTSGRTYIYKVGTILDSDNTVIACAELVDKATGMLLATASVDTSIASANLPAGNVIAYAGIKGANVTTTFKITKKPYVGDVSFSAKGHSIASDGTVTLTASSLKSSSQPFTLIPAALTSSGDATGVDNPYFAYKGAYGVGTYVDITFTGNNMPEVMFFADVINGNMSGYSAFKGGTNDNKGTPTGEKGVLISNGMKGGNVGNDIDEYFTVWGPNKVYFGDIALNGAFVSNTYLSKALIKIQDTNATHGGLVQTKLDATKTYKETVGTYNADGKLGIHVKLVEVTATSEVLVAELKQATTVAVTEISAGNIILYSSMTGSNTVFKYSAPYTVA